MKKSSRVALAATSLTLFAVMSGGPAVADHAEVIIDEDGNAVSAHPPLNDHEPEPVTEEIVIVVPGPEGPTEPAPAPEETAPAPEPIPNTPVEDGVIGGDTPEAPPAPAPKPGDDVPSPIDDPINSGPKDPGAGEECTAETLDEVRCGGDGQDNGVTAGAPCLPVGSPVSAELAAKGGKIKWCATSTVKKVPTPEVEQKVQPLIETGVSQKNDSPDSIFLVMGLLGVAGASVITVLTARSRKESKSTVA